jgi:hypothetical protein
MAARRRCVSCVFRHVASLYFKYFSCFRCTFRVFRTNVAKVYQDIAYVAMIVHVCCKRLAPVFHLCFSDVCCKCVYLDVPYVSHICCKCFIWMLCLFAMVLKYFRVFLQVLQMHVSSISSIFFCMLQVLHPNVSKVYRGYAHGMCVES